MRITIFVGPPKAGGDALRAHLKANAKLVEKHGSYLRIDASHTGALAKSMRVGAPPQKFLTDMKIPEDAHSLLLWDETLLGAVEKPFGKRFWYGTARARMENIHKYFEDFEVITAMALRDPTDLIPALYADNLRRRNLLPFKNYIGQVPLDKLQWSELIERVQLRDEYKPMLTWAYEDYAYIWRDVIEAMLDIPNGQVLLGKPPAPEISISVSQAEYYFDGSQKLSSEGTKLEDSHWKMFLDMYNTLTGLPENPGWTLEQQDHLSDIYDEDLYTIARMDAVHMIERRKRM